MSHVEQSESVWSKMKSIVEFTQPKYNQIIQKILIETLKSHCGVK